MMKDYYSILEIPTHATLPEIRQAYRRLAKIYHPDKTNNDPYGQVQFNEIKEAYDVLTNPIKKEAYLQDRWYNQSIGKKRTAGPLTPVSILKLCLELERYISGLDIYRMDKEGLARYIDELLSSGTLETLQQFSDRGINQQVISTLLRAAKPLPLKLTRPVLSKLELLAGDNKAASQCIGEFIRAHTRAHLWEKYKILVVIVFALLICLLIFFTSK